MKVTAVNPQWRSLFEVALCGFCTRTLWSGSKSKISTQHTDTDTLHGVLLYILTHSRHSMFCKYTDTLVVPNISSSGSFICFKSPSTQNLVPVSEAEPMSRICDITNQPEASRSSTQQWDTKNGINQYDKTPFYSMSVVGLGWRTHLSSIPEFPSLKVISIPYAVPMQLVMNLCERMRGTSWTHTRASSQRRPCVHARTLCIVTRP